MNNKILVRNMILTILTIMKERQISHDSLNWRNKWDETYDFIVVGAGTAGSVVAARLSEDGNKKILLIEAGKPQNIGSDIPAFEDRSIGTELDWNFPIVPQEYANQANIENHLNLHRGKAFGGCSMHNGMNYYRESPEFFQLWADITGAKTWNYSYVLPYFTKSENNLDQSLVANDPAVHTTGGPLTVTTVVPNKMMKAYLRAATIKGYPITYPDGRQPFGTTILQRNIKNGVRQSTSLVFLEHNHRKNLHILGQTLVTKILFNEKKRAIGVQFFRNNKFHTVFAKYEIILSAGVVGSPHLLLLSGIGPTEHLEHINIPLVSNLKVGYNFLNTIGFGIGFDIKDQSMVERPDQTLNQFYNYFVHNSGPFAYKATGLTCFHLVHYPNQPNFSNGCNYFTTSFVGNNLETIVKDYKRREEWAQYYRPYLNRSSFNLVTQLRKPQSVGRIKLISNNPFQYPLIDPCFLCVERDLADFVKAFKLSLDIFLSPYMRQFVELYKKPIPGCNPCSNEYFCETYIRCIIREIAGRSYPVGGCRIGIASDREAVVDQRLRVFGVSGLRVIDSSIIPLATDQGTATTIMIGEYGSDLINQEHHFK